jgi:chromosome segregation ATPase
MNMMEQINNAIAEKDAEIERLKGELASRIDCADEEYRADIERLKSHIKCLDALRQKDEAEIQWLRVQTSDKGLLIQINQLQGDIKQCEQALSDRDAEIERLNNDYKKLLALLRVAVKENDRLQELLEEWLEVDRYSDFGIAGDDLIERTRDAITKEDKP